MTNEEKALLEKIAKQNEEILKNQRKAENQRKEETYEDPYWTNYNKQRAERGILS
ncbi:hypothetical protein [Bacillus sp. M6-12]|uniref:hypothetical protein n=1 Tax=Bacillus sp. M6-12 TaxID=2054166 RepID=UPI0015E15197|nr:hypothetical protein [Bacillus sp. M6-12]